MKILNTATILILSVMLLGTVCDHGGKGKSVTMKLDTSDGIWLNSVPYDTYWDYDKNLTENAESDFKEIGILLGTLASKYNWAIPEKRKTIISDLKAQYPEVLGKVVNNYTQIIKNGELKNPIHTYWNFQNLYLKISNVRKNRDYKLTISAKNNNLLGPLPTGYDNFEIQILNVSDVNNTIELGTINIDAIEADADGYESGSLIIPLAKGDTLLNIVWLNDAQSENNDGDGDSAVGDANLQIMRIKLKKQK